MRLLFLVFILALPLMLFGQEKPQNKNPKNKVDPKSLESLIGLEDDESDVLFKGSHSNEINQYLKSINLKKGANTVENDVNIKKIFEQISRSINQAKSKVYFNNTTKSDSIKKINDLADNSTNSESFLFFNRFLIKISGSKQNSQSKIQLQNKTYTVNEVVADENFQVTLFEIEQKPESILQQTKFASAPSEGNMLYKLSADSSASVVLVKKHKTFNYLEKIYKSFEVLSIDNVKDGDLFFNDDGQLCGVAYVIKDKTIIVEGLFVNQIVADLIIKAGSRLFVGLMGEFSKEGFLVSENIRNDLAIEPGDVIKELNGNSIKKDTFYQLKKSYKIKTSVNIKILRKSETIELKCVPNEFLINSLIEKCKSNSYQKVLIWFDPTDAKQLAEVIKYEKVLQTMKVKAFEWRYYRMNDESLLDWISTVKLIQFLNSQQIKGINEWFIKNAYIDSDDFIKKLCIQFQQESEKVKDVLNNKASEEKILAYISDGLLQYKIVALPSVAFENSKSLPVTIDLETAVSDLYYENGL